MQQAAILTWLRCTAWMSLGVAPVFVTLGILYRKPEWALSGGLLAVYGLLELRRNRHTRKRLGPSADFGSVVKRADGAPGK